MATTVTMGTRVTTGTSVNGLSLFQVFLPRPIRTLNGRLPVKLGSEQRETLPERVSNHFGRLSFRRQKLFFLRRIRTEHFVFLQIWRGF